MPRTVIRPRMSSGHSRTFLMSSAVTTPSRMTFRASFPPTIETTVDALPPVTVMTPPSTAKSGSPSSPASASSTLTAGGVPDRFALVAAATQPAVSSIFRRNGWSGIRSPIVSPGVLPSTTTVRGPGQNLSASLSRSAEGLTPARTAASTEGASICRSLFWGRCFSA